MLINKRYLGITEAFSVAQAKEQMEVNYFGAIRTMQAVLPSMRTAKAGLIINTSSLAGQISPPFFSTTAQPSTCWRAMCRGYATRCRPLALMSLLCSLAPLALGCSQAAKHRSTLMCWQLMATCRVFSMQLASTLQRPCKQCGTCGVG